MISCHLFNGFGFFVLQKQTITAVKKEVMCLPVPGKFDLKSSDELYVPWFYALHSVMK